MLTTCGGHMKAGILAIGTEILMGKITNTNATFLSEKLNSMGIGVYYHMVVGDNKGRVMKAFTELLDACDIIVTTGGLGPTMDDLTKETLAEVLGLEMVLDPQSLDFIKGRFKLFNRTMPESNVKQAYFPEGAMVLSNDMGTAPACYMKHEWFGQMKHIFVMPGPPKEMTFIYQTHLEAILCQLSDNFMYSKYLSLYDIGESSIEEQLIDLFERQTSPTLATYASDGHVLLRITAFGQSEAENANKVSDMIQCVRERIGAHIVSEDGETIERVVVKMLEDQGLSLSVSESCTGGGLAARIVSCPGASSVLYAGYVTYSNASKMSDLNVSPQTLDDFGAVSHQTCHEMVRGTQERTQADVVISITGIAGPSGGSFEKPVGRVYIGVGFKGNIVTFENQFAGNRQQIQSRAVNKALKHLYDVLNKNVNN